MNLIKRNNIRLDLTLSLLLSVLVVTTKMATAGTISPSASANRNLFAADIFQKVVAGNTKNVVFSPASIQSCLALAFFATDGKTAEELRNGLHLGNGDRKDIAETFEEFISTSFKTSKDDNAVQLRMANRIYVNSALQLNQKFNEIATKAFQSEAEKINFADSASAANKINKFVEEQTNQKIKNLIPENAFDGATSVVLVNAIYFKGKWQIPFSADSTIKRDFAVHGKHKIPVDTMYMDERVQYGEFPDLDAKVLELRYANSDLSMIFLLPNAVDGLNALERKLAKRDLNEIASKLSEESVDVSIPKFRIEFDIDLNNLLMELGIKTMFSNSADFSKLLEDASQQKVSEVKHKAYIDVNEAGSEAAAATFMKIVPMSMNLDQKVFQADHPFVFAIRSPKAVYFSGHVVEF